MYIFFKKQGILIDPERDNMFVVDNQITFMLVPEADEVVLNVSREELEQFVAQFEQALNQKRQLWTFDQDKPKYVMRLSGRDEEESDEPPAGVDLGGFE